jgi:hypothetical protein
VHTELYIKGDKPVGLGAAPATVGSVSSSFPFGAVTKPGGDSMQDDDDSFFMA